MQRRFESVPIFQATTLLLQERIPSQAFFQSHSPELAEIRTAVATQELPMRIVRRADTASPEVQLLSNGRYSVVVTNADFDISPGMATSSARTTPGSGGWPAFWGGGGGEV